MAIATPTETTGRGELDAGGLDPTEDLTVSNADVITQLDALADGLGALRQDLDRSEDLPATSAAPAIVAAMRLNSAFAKLAKEARKKLAPLFGKDAAGGQGDGDKPKRPRK